MLRSMMVIVSGTSALESGGTGASAQTAVSRSQGLFVGLLFLAYSMRNGRIEFRKIAKRAGIGGCQCSDGIHLLRRDSLYGIQKCPLIGIGVELFVDEYAIPRISGQSLQR